MFDAENQNAGLTDIDEYLVRNRIIDQLMVILASSAGFVFFLAELRALEIGWSIRDLIQFICMAAMILITIYGRRLLMQHKIFLMVLITFSIGMTGFFTMGILTAGIMFLPLSGLFVALFYSRLGMTVFILISMISLGSISMKFISGGPVLHENTMALLNSRLHWAEYIICIGYFFIVCGITILGYRNAVGNLVKELKDRRDQLSRKNQDLQKALDEIKMLRRILPLCSFCKKVRNDKGYWEQVDIYLEKHTMTNISHGVCPDCMKKHYPYV